MRATEFTKVNEGVNDPAIFKAVFIIGGPGSGKSYVARQLGLSALGYVNVNSDIAFEYLMKKHELDPKMPPEQQSKRDVVRQRAKDITADKSELAIDGRLGLVIDGTGDDYEKVSKLKSNFDALGYTTFLVVVNTELEVARQRNQQRARTVPDKLVVQSWYSVQNNIGKFAQIFDNVSIIDNSGDGSSTESQIQNTYKKLVKFTNTPPNKPQAKQWIAKQTQTNESIDVEKSFPIESWYEDDDTYANVAVAHDSEGRDIEIIFTPLHEEINAIDFDFTRGGTYEKTGEGDAGKVFATVLKAFNEYLKNINVPDYILFASKGGSRTSAYQAMIRRFAGRYGYKQIPYNQLPDEIANQPQAEGHQFVLSRV